MGEALRKLNKNEEAIKSYKEAIKLAKEETDPDELKNAHTQTAICYNGLGLITRAEAKYADSI